MRNVTRYKYFFRKFRQLLTFNHINHIIANFQIPTFSNFQIALPHHHQLLAHSTATICIYFAHIHAGRQVGDGDSGTAARKRVSMHKPAGEVIDSYAGMER